MKSILSFAVSVNAKKDEKKSKATDDDKNIRLFPALFMSIKIDAKNNPATAASKFMRIRLAGIKKLSRDLKPCFSDETGKNKQNKRHGNSGGTALKNIPSAETASTNVRINIKAVADDRRPRLIFSLKNEITEKSERNSK
ncbi:hypothetical protein JW890_00030 [candidate division WOR-3 bacterium]|nr:hypothetical protein [candidate division WOR-3 bacterium]